MQRPFPHAFFGKCPESYPDWLTDGRTDQKDGSGWTDGPTDQCTGGKRVIQASDGRTDRWTNGRTTWNIMHPAPKGGGIKMKFNKFSLNLESIIRYQQHRNITNERFMCLCQVTEDEICKMIMSLNYGAADMMKFIHEFWRWFQILYIRHWLIYAIYLFQGFFSSRIHTGKCHTSKSGDPGALNHYQPMSLLSVLLKVFEKVVMNNCLINYIDIYMIYFFSINLV